MIIWQKDNITYHEIFGKRFVVMEKDEYKYLFRENGDYVRMFFNKSIEDIQEYVVNNF